LPKSFVLRVTNVALLASTMVAISRSPRPTGEAVVGLLELFAVRRFQDGGETPLEDFDPGDDRQDDILGRLRLPQAHPGVALK
jgi:hypothetical protein